MKNSRTPGVASSRSLFELLSQRRSMANDQLDRKRRSAIQADGDSLDTDSDEIPTSTLQWAQNPANPFSWSPSRKWIITSCVCAVSFAAGINATAIATPGREIAVTFKVSDDNFPNSFWPITAWTMGAAFGPMIGMPLLENFGTRKGYLVHIREFA